MNAIMEPYNELEGETWDYLRAVIKGKSAKAVANKEKKLIAALTEAKSQVYKVRTYKKDSILKPAMVDYLTILKQMLNDEYSKIVDMEEIAEKSYDAMEAYLMAKEAVSEKQNKEYDKLHEAYKVFALQHKVVLKETGTLNERQLKIKRANQCLAYDNELFLLHFKVSHQESYVIDAINKKDLNALEQSMGTLNQFATENLETLEGIEAYNGDASLKDAVKDILNFYKRESESELTSATDFLLLEQKVKKATKRMESKSKKDITQEGIDEYNGLLGQYNSAVGKFNNMLTKLNKDKTEETNKFYKARDQFLNKNG